MSSPRRPGRAGRIPSPMFLTPQRFCACGLQAVYRLRVRCLDANLEKYHYGTLYLCEPCYKDEVESCDRAKRLPPYVSPVKPPGLLVTRRGRKRVYRRRAG